MPRPTLRLASAALMVAGLSLVAAPLAAAAHTGNLYTWAYSEDSNFFGITKISTADASLTQLAPAPVVQYVTGADICNEAAFGVVDSNEETEIPGVLTWNHDTGVLGTQHDLTANIADFPDSTDVDALEAFAADSLSGCSAIAYVRYEVTDGENTTFPIFVSYVDVATGLTTPITELPELSEGSSIEWEGIATDPVTGVTYLFAAFLGTTHFAVLDVTTGAVSGMQSMDGLWAFFDESNQFPVEADFQPDGKLWMLIGVNELEEFHLVSFAAGASLAAASPTDVGDLDAGDGATFFEGDNVLTYDPEALANTGGGVPLGLLLPGAVLFLGGLALVAVRRVRTAE